jgi:hypothetical protein
MLPAAKANTVSKRGGPPLMVPLVGGLVLLALLAAPASGQQPLHQRIDQEIAAGFAGPFAPVADDGGFVRRIYLDLTGRVPTAGQARAFLDGPSSEKRRTLIDRLLASPHFARRMQQVFDVMLMERRPDVHVPEVAWREYLRKSFLNGKPYNKLAAEILASDGADPALRPAAKFYLDRGCEANLVTRDVGRVFFGMDLQCAQCHDHPLVGSYYQSDYYGLYAFLNRSFVFTDQAKTAYLAEKADGEVTFVSVFVSGDQPHPSGPHLPGQPPIAEPQFEAAAYLVPPADGVRPVPRFSRRKALAREATSGQNADFNRNIANRLWAVMLGRGLVHPVDFLHADNPPSHPALLDLLAAEFAAMKFDVRGLLREIALSQTYQRSSRLPAGVDPASVPGDRFAVADLKPLSPEQLAWSLMTSAGWVSAYEQSARASLDADPRLAELLALDPRRAAERAEMEEVQVYNSLQGNCAAFVSLFAGAPGQAASTFQATVHQALFLANGDPIRALLQPGGYLVGQVAAVDNHLAAEELYLAVYARRPEREEALETAAYLAARPNDRTVAIQELVWGMWMSPEFRFNH